MNFYIPSDIDLQQILPDYLQKYVDYAAYLLDFVALRQRDDEFVSINSRWMRDMFPDRNIYSLIKKSLIIHKALACDCYYQRDVKCLGYRVEQQTFKSHEVTNKFLLKKLKKPQQTTALVQNIRKNLLRLDVPNVIGDTASISQLQLQRIKDKEVFASRDQYGRVHTNLTVLKSEYRSQLVVDNHKLANVDVRNSQPLMLSVMLRMAAAQRHKSSLFSSIYSILYSNSGREIEDVRQYEELCCQGKLYDFLMSEIGYESDRKQFKLDLFSNIFFCRNNPNSYYHQVFKKYFPTILRLISELKRKDHTVLAKLLQKAESTLVIDGVLSEFMENSPKIFVGSIHDSLLTEASATGRAIELFQKHFQKVGLVPTVSVEFYGE